jgi:hypothetical protein
MGRAFRILSIVFSKPNCGSDDFEILLVLVGKFVELRADDVSEARSERSPRERKDARKLCPQPISGHLT